MTSHSGDGADRILVIGDWVIDDYWLCGEHRSVTASRVGQKHLRALHAPTEKVRTLAGAARVTSLLYRAADVSPNETHRACEIVGLGFWHPEDHAVLACATADPDFFNGWTPGRLSAPSFGSGPDNLKLINLAEHVSEENRATTRVLRVLLQEEAGLESLGRVDWETRPKTDERKSADAMGVEPYLAWDFSSEKLGNAFKSLPTTEPFCFSAVVVKDQRKGVVSRNLIKWIVDNINGTRAEDGSTRPVEWFISTKAHLPEWFDCLAEKRANGTVQQHSPRLILIPEIAAADAVRKGVYTWFTPTDRGGKPTSEALEEVTKVWERVGGRDQPNLLVVVLPGQYRVLARAADKGVFQLKPNPVPFCEHAAMASACFPYLVQRLLGAKSGELQDFIHEALNDTYKFNQEEKYWISQGSRTPVNWIPDPPGFPKSDVVPFEWSKEQKGWASARKYPCILEEVEPRFELWRAMTEIPRFVCCIPKRRRRLAKLLQEIRDFAQQGRRTHNLSGLIVANPGAGKTTLVRELADSVGVPWLEFNITQLLRRDDLFACFDTIVTTQAQARPRPVLVFVDEINALLEGHHVYDAFLSPLEDSVYLRAGRKFFLRPCIWLFASTEHLRRLEDGENEKGAVKKSEEAEEKKKAEKEMDFTSRLTMDDITLIPDPEWNLSGSDLQEWQRIENVYRGVAMIRHQFPDVRAVSRGLLDYFYHLKPDYSARQLRSLIKRLRNVQYSHVSLSNLPDDTQWICADDVKETALGKDKQPVAIV